MKHNATNMYDVDRHIAEVYDQIETDTEDVQLIRSLIQPQKGLHILEPFCGTGRILIPLASDGHYLTGLDQSKGMLDCALVKIRLLCDEVQRRITLNTVDLVVEDWPAVFDLVILGNNCFYELATAEEQEKCVISAAKSLKSGGYLYIDNAHMEGNLDVSWQQPGVRQGFPTGTCIDGTNIKSNMETIWFDEFSRLVRFRRNTTIIHPDGSRIEKEYIQQKHPVSYGEVNTWLKSHGFIVKRLYGDRSGNSYTEKSPRAIFWAEKC